MKETKPKKITFWNIIRLFYESKFCFIKAKNKYKTMLHLKIFGVCLKNIFNTNIEKIYY